MVRHQVHAHHRLEDSLVVIPSAPQNEPHYDSHVTHREESTGSTDEKMPVLRVCIVLSRTGLHETGFEFDPEMLYSLHDRPREVPYLLGSVA